MPILFIINGLPPIAGEIAPNSIHTLSLSQREKYNLHLLTLRNARGVLLCVTLNKLGDDATTHHPIRPRRGRTIVRACHFL